jgi:hypothetical protein
VRVYLEVGKKKIFAGALDWPGWCRSGLDESAALRALLDYAPRYARVLEGSGLEFQAPGSTGDFTILERLPGDATTDFGAPGMIPHADQLPVDRGDLDRYLAILAACWRAFERAAERAAALEATGGELRKGPRGGGRDLDKMIEHVLGGDQAYLRRLAWKFNPGVETDRMDALHRTWQQFPLALEIGLRGELPAQGPRGGSVWPPRYFVRRSAWHVLDHAWEIEDRIT